MTLRKKTLFAIAATLIGLNAALYVVSSSILVRNALEEEKVNAHQNIKETVNILLNDRLLFQERWNDWSQWDDTYAFIENRNQTYISSNLGDQQLANLKINAIAYVDLKGQIVYSTGFDWQKKQRSPLPEQIEQDIKTGSLLSRQKPQQPLTRLVMMPQAPMLITAHPILTSEAIGPVRGTVIFGRYLDSSYLNTLVQVSGLNIKVLTYNEQNLPLEWQKAKIALGSNPIHLPSEPIPVFIEPLSDSVLSTYTVIKDLEGNPDLLLRIDRNRTTFQNAQQAVIQLMCLMIGTGTIFGIVTLLSLEKLVLSRISRLDRCITEISATGDLSARFGLTDDDELGNFTNSMNQLLQVLEQRDRQQSQSAIALRQSENRNQAIVSAFPDLMIRLNRDGTYLDMKPGKDVKTLYPIETTIHKNIADFLPPDVYQQRMHHIEQALLTGKVQIFDYQLSIDGEILDYEGRIAVSGEDEVLMIVRDISDRKRADRETQLLLSLNQAINEAPDFDAALQALLQGVCEATGWYYGEAWSVSADGLVLECRPSRYCKPLDDEKMAAALQEFRTFSEGFSFLPNEDLVGRVWASQQVEWIQDLDSYPQSFLRTSLATAADLNSLLGIPILIKDEPTSSQSQVLAILVFCTVKIREHDRRSVKLISDVAEQLGAAIQQKRTAAELRALFRAMTDVIMVIDSQGYYLKVTPTNDALLVRPAEELVGKTLYQVFERSQAEQFMHQIWQVLNTQQTLNTEYLLEINGKPIWFSASVSPIADDSVIWVARDISDRKASELELQQAKEDADAANKAKTSFLAKMSHELRTPLNAILGFTQLMVSDLALTQEQRENLRIINNSGEHLLALINDVLEMSKIELGKISLNANHFDLYALLDGIQDMLRQRAETKGLQLIFERTQSLPQHIETDEIKLRQVMINLLTNAIKFTHRGSVILRASTGAIDRSSSTVNLKFEVEDTGVGIATEESDCVFEIFAQTESGVKSNEGTGLGLPISREIVRLMGGDITFTSVLGQGTVFRFDILAKLVDRAVAQDDSVEADREAKTSTTLRILLAEDNPVNQIVALRMLGKLGYDAAVANNGLEVLTCLHQSTYDIILMDVQMPEMDGLEATQQICQKWQPQERPIIIAMTAGAMHEDRDRCLAAGMNDYVSKPIRLETLKAALNHWGAKIHSH
ncbi:CHASE4 domain-containing protein [Tumidithrix helvetica PCC 7403]|uniref:CHASE4 domain-containing protein n=1 Tax=Tumidithrix helvetica TaxID=3457545 RepID=UPI003C9E6233